MCAQCVLRRRPDKGGGCQSLERTKNKAVEVSPVFVLRGRAPSLIRVVLGATQTSYYSDRSSRSRELGVVGAAAESFIQLGRQR